MSHGLRGSFLVAASILSMPAVAFAQNVGPAPTSRSYLFVLLAFAAGWLLIGAWVFQIGRKMDRLSQRIEQDTLEQEDAPPTVETRRQHGI